MSCASPTIRLTRPGRSIQIGMLRETALIDIDLPIAGLSEELAGLRILHLADAHFGPKWCNGYDRLLQAIAELNVDLIAFTGDWVEDKFDFRNGLETTQRFARQLKSKFGTFCCLGNHDGDLITPYLMDAGMTVLVGEAKRILGGASMLEIIGLPGVMRGDASPLMIESFGAPATDAFRLVLTHFPDDISRVAPMRPHLVLAGHTHGGQICLPNGRPIITHDSLPRAFSSGLHRIEQSWLHVSRGFGCSALNLRLWCPAEINLITLRAS